MSEPLHFGSLFSGIGGLDLGLERAGFKIAWQCEKDEFCQKVLKKHWPDIPKFMDIQDPHVLECIRELNEAIAIDALVGGIPCQPHSFAGKRQASADDRNLWPEFARFIRELKPRWVVVENVVGLLSSENGDFFGSILGDLAQMGYDAQWGVLSAAQFGAPHLRERVFIVAYLTDSRRKEQPNTERLHTESYSSSIDVAHSMRSRQQEQYTSTIASYERHTTRIVDTSKGKGLAQSGICRGANGHADWMDRYRWPAGPGQEQYDFEPPRVTQEKVPHRAARLKALGNAVVPQCAEYIAHMIMIMEMEREHATH